jgi:hypothetical protein
MSRSLPTILALLLTGGLVVSACASGSASPAPSGATGQAGDVAVSSEAQPCSADQGIARDIPGWPLAGGGDVQFLPVVMSSLATVGPNRFLYNVLDAGNGQLGAPDVASTADFYAVERDPDTPVARTTGTYLSAGPGRGLYRANVDFDCVGEWGVEITIEQPDGTKASERMRFTVAAAGPTVGIGQEAPRSESLTASTPEEAATISTDPDPYLPAYQETVAQAVTSGRPSLILFATPAFCQTGYCGPTIDLIKGVARRYAGRVDLVAVEPYELHETPNGLQPSLDADGRLQPVQAAIDYGIPVEPYLFLVDASGHVFARFEGLVGEQELHAAIDDALRSAGSAATG